MGCEFKSGGGLLIHVFSERSPIDIVGIEVGGVRRRFAVVGGDGSGMWKDELWENDRYHKDRRVLVIVLIRLGWGTVLLSLECSRCRFWSSSVWGFRRSAILG